MSFEVSSQSQDVFYRCVEDSNDTIMITDLRGKLIYVNPAWEKVYGFRKEEALGKTPRIIQSGLQDREFYQLMWKDILSQEKGFWRGELQNRTKSGELVDVLLNITPFRDNSGSIRGFMGIAMDISQTKAMQNMLAQQDRLASIGYIASGLAHEIGTPLGVIRGRAEQLQEKLSHTEGASKSLTVIISQIDRISRLIQSLLRFSRKTEQLKTKSVDLRNLVDEVFDLVRDKSNQFDIDCRNEIEAGIILKTDRDRLEQILLNLAINSIQAMGKGAKPDREDSENILKVSGQQTDEGFLLAISDTGCGIPQENLSHIFEPFFTTKSPEEGTGLGLSVVNKLVFELAGKIEVNSNPNEGTTFLIRLPQ